MGVLHFPKKITIYKNEKGVSALFVFLSLIALLLMAWGTAHAAFRHYGLFAVWSTPFENDRFAFSLPVPVIAMYIVYVLVLAFCFSHVIMHYERMHRLEAFAWCLVFAGALYNITERIAFGYVRDYIPVGSGIFNAPDFYIIFGVLILLTKTK